MQPAAGTLFYAGPAELHAAAALATVFYFEATHEILLRSICMYIRHTYHAAPAVIYFISYRELLKLCSRATATN